MCLNECIEHKIKGNIMTDDNNLDKRLTQDRIETEKKANASKGMVIATIIIVIGIIAGFYLFNRPVVVATQENPQSAPNTYSSQQNAPVNNSTPSQMPVNNPTTTQTPGNNPETTQTNTP